MTIKELKERLDIYPDDYLIAANWELIEKEDIYLVKEFFNGDSANPMCEVLENKVVHFGY